MQRDLEYYENEVRRLETLTAQLKVSYNKDLEDSNAKLEALRKENVSLSQDLVREKAKSMYGQTDENPDKTTIKSL